VSECVRERQRETQREREREKESKKDSAPACESVYARARETERAKQ